MVFLVPAIHTAAGDGVVTTVCVQGAPFTGRVFVTHAGWRQTEPASLTAVATHHCFTHLLTHLVGHMLDAQKSDDRSTGDDE